MDFYLDWSDLQLMVDVSVLKRIKEDPRQGFWYFVIYMFNGYKNRAYDTPRTTLDYEPKARNLHGNLSA